MDPVLFAELRDLCLRSFPERLGQRLSQVESMEADRYLMLAFTLSWREGIRPRVERLLVRRYVDDRTWWLPHDVGKAHREWLVMRWLYGHGLPVPEVYALGALERDSFLLLARPSGQTIVPRANGQRSAGRTPAGHHPTAADTPVLRQHVDQLAELLARLHRLRSPDSVREVLPRADVNGVLDRAASIALRFEDRALMEAVHELTQDRVEEGPPCVLHGDPQLANCRYDARGITAWLNWEHSALGDPRWDVACVANELQDSSPLADRFCETYAAQAGLPVHDMAYWRALSAVHRWAVTKQAHPTVSTEDESPLAAQRQEYQKRAEWALDRRAVDRRRDTGTVPTEPET